MAGSEISFHPLDDVQSLVPKVVIANYGVSLEINERHEDWRGSHLHGVHVFREPVAAQAFVSDLIRTAVAALIESAGESAWEQLYKEIEGICRHEHSAWPVADADSRGVAATLCADHYDEAGRDEKADREVDEARLDAVGGTEPVGVAS